MAYKQEYDKLTSTKRELKTGDTVLLKQTFGEYPKMLVKWLYDPYTLVKRIGPVNWVVANKDGMQKVYHQDLLKYLGVRSEPEFTVEHKHYCLRKILNQDPYIKVSFSSEQQAPITPTNVLQSVINRQGFRNNVFQHNFNNGVNPSVSTVQTYSNRELRPVLGNWLIDQLQT